MSLSPRLSQIEERLRDILNRIDALRAKRAEIDAEEKRLSAELDAIAGRARSGAGNTQAIKKPKRTLEQREEAEAAYDRKHGFSD